MSNSIGDILELIKPFGARLDAGADGLGRSAAWVHSSDLPDVGIWLRGGEVVLNTALHIDGPEAATSLLQSLAKGAAAAVIFADDPGLKEPARRAIRRLGNRLKLPIIYMPVAVKFVDVTQTISRSIISSQYETLRYWETIHERFIRSALEGRGMKEVVDLLAEILKREVGLVDSQLRTVSSTGRAPDRDGGSGNPDGWLPRGLEPGKVWKDVIVRTSGLRSVPELGAWVQQIRARGDLLGLLLVRGQAELSERDRIAIDQAAIALALELLKERELRDLDGRLGFELLADILTGKMRDYEEAQRRAGFLGFDLAAPYRVLVIEESTGARTAALAPLRRRKQRFLRAIDWAQGPNPFRMMVMARSDALVILSFEPPGSDVLRKFAAALITKLEAESSGSRFLGGISASHAGASEVQPAYEEALRTREIGSRLKPDERVTSFDELGIHGLILGLAGKELVRLSHQRLDALEATLHGRELRQTVEAYLENEGSISRTASGLRIHRNTVLQRLQRVKSVTGLDPQKVRDRMSLTILLTAEAFSRPG